MPYKSKLLEIIAVFIVSVIGLSLNLCIAYILSSIFNINVFLFRQTSILLVFNWNFLI